MTGTPRGRLRPSPVENLPFPSCLLQPSKSPHKEPV